jgi:hypothetical protein
MKDQRPDSSTPVIAMLSWMIAVIAAWFAVGSQTWGQTILLAAVGALYLFSPPSGVFPKSLLIVFGLILLLAATAFLPAAWVGSAFHQPFLDHGIILSATLSPQPWLSLEDITFLFATLLWGWSCFETKISLEQRKLLRTCYIGAMAVVAAVTINHGTLFFANLPAFVQGIGQFANRNQTGDLLVMAGIICFAQAISDLSKRYATGAIWIGLTGLFMAATIRNGSRADAALFAVGLLFVVILMPRAQYRPWLSPVLVLIVFLSGLLVVALGGGNLMNRFQLMFEGGPEGRLGIYRDAVRMVFRDPWCGVGLGNFPGVFNTQRLYSAGQNAPCLHPESDWLWVATEMGVLGVILFALVVALTFRIYLWQTPFRRLSRTCIAVALVFLIHSFFDVGGHRLGTIWSCLYLVSLGAFRPALVTDTKVPRIFLHVVGLLLLLVAALRVQSMSVEPFMPTRASVAKVIDSLSPKIALPKQKELLEQSIGWAPLDDKPYYLRALVLMSLPDIPNEKIDDDFNRALFLDQSSIDLPISVGEICRSVDFPESLVAWKALMQRAGPRREELFENLYGRPNLDLKTRMAMTSLTEDDPSLKAIAVTHEVPPEFDLLLQNLLESNPTLHGISPALLEKLFNRWVEIGNGEEFLESWPLHTEWQVPGWRAFARGLAHSGRFKEAASTALKFMPPPIIPDVSTTQDLTVTERQYLDNPKDSFLGIRLYFAQMSAGLDDKARNTLIEVAKLPQPPPYIRYLLAKNLNAAGQDEAAWQAIEPVIDEH